MAPAPDTTPPWMEELFNTVLNLGGGADQADIWLEIIQMANNMAIAQHDVGLGLVEFIRDQMADPFNILSAVSLFGQGGGGTLGSAEGFAKTGGAPSDLGPMFDEILQSVSRFALGDFEVPLPAVPGVGPVVEPVVEPVDEPVADVPTTPPVEPTSSPMAVLLPLFANLNQVNSITAKQIKQAILAGTMPASYEAFAAMALGFEAGTITLDQMQRAITNFTVSGGTVFPPFGGGGDSGQAVAEAQPQVAQAPQPTPLPAVQEVPTPLAPVETPTKVVL